MAHAPFYEKPVALDREAHKKLRIDQSEASFGFAANASAVILAEVEFPLAARDYPIVFVRIADGKMFPAALLGIRNDENLFVANGEWRKNSYVPAFVRRYPFIPAETGSSELAVCIDDGYKGLASDTGEPLFDEHGQPSALLTQAIALMQDYHAECKRTESFVQLLGGLNLLKEISIRVQMKDGTPYPLSGVWVVDEAALAGLKAKDQVWELFEGGHLPAIYAHLFSLGNLGRLVELLAERSLSHKKPKSTDPVEDRSVGKSAPNKDAAALATA